ncbi:MAG: methyl-accepting chemotaxis protein, partial [Thermomicrobium sp.]|nr:methyl-accepting chemotaxis protein [Thermomicrobium sp.]
MELLLVVVVLLERRDRGDVRRVWMGLLFRLKLSGQLGVLIGVLAVGFVLSTAYGVWTMRTVMVGGPLFAAIQRDHELTADILPPPAYIVDAYANVLQLSVAYRHGADAAEIERLLADAARTHSEYEARLSYWSSTLPEGPLRETLTVRAAEPAREFFRIRDESLIPALQAGEFHRADELIWQELRPRFLVHRAAIDEAVRLARETAAGTQQAASARVDRAQLMVPAVAVVAILLGVASGTLFARVLGRRLRAVANALDSLSTQDLPALERALAAFAAGDTRVRFRLEAQPLEGAGGDESAQLIGVYNRLIRSLRAVEQSFVAMRDTLHGVVTSIGDVSRAMRAVSDELHERVGNMSTALEQVVGSARIVSAGSAQQSDELHALQQALTDLEEMAKALARTASAQSAAVERLAGLARTLADQSAEVARTAEAVGGVARQHAEHARVGREALDRTERSFATARSRWDAVRTSINDMVEHARAVERVSALVGS